MNTTSASSRKQRSDDLGGVRDAARQRAVQLDRAGDADARERDLVVGRHRQPRAVAEQGHRGPRSARARGAVVHADHAELAATLHELAVGRPGDRAWTRRDGATRHRRRAPPWRRRPRAGRRRCRISGLISTSSASSSIRVSTVLRTSVCELARRSRLRDRARAAAAAPGTRQGRSADRRRRLSDLARAAPARCPRRRRRSR